MICCAYNNKDNQNIKNFSYHSSREKKGSNNRVHLGNNFGQIEDKKIQINNFYRSSNKPIDNNINININSNLGNVRNNNMINNANNKSNNLLSDLKKTKKISLLDSILKCFCSIDKLVKYFKSEMKVSKILEQKLKNSLSHSFKILIEDLYPNYKNNNIKSSHKNFNDKLKKMSHLFSKITANESNDLIYFIINRLHDELNKTPNAIDTIDNNNISMDQRNQQLMFQQYAQNFAKNNISIISDLFYGTNCNVTQCLNCSSRAYNYQTFFVLIFPIEEVKKYKLQYYDNNTEIIDINDCFLYNQKMEIMSGDNAIYCVYCKQISNFSINTYLSLMPNILIIILNREKEPQFKIKYFQDLNLEKFVEHKEAGYKYNLIGVINYSDKNNDNDNFITYCKDPIDKKWYLMKDDKDILIENIQNKINDNLCPHVLFYQKA